MVCKGAGQGEPVVQRLPWASRITPEQESSACLPFEFELHTHVTIALNKLDALSMETTGIRARVPWGPLVASSLKLVLYCVTCAHMREGTETLPPSPVSRPLLHFYVGSGYTRLLAWCVTITYCTG